MNNRKEQESRSKKRQKEVVTQRYAELHNGSFVKIIHEYKNGMFLGEVYAEHTNKPTGSIFFPKNYIKSLEEIVVNDETSKRN